MCESMLGLFLMMVEKIVCCGLCFDFVLGLMWMFCVLWWLLGCGCLLGVGFCSFV